MQNQQNTTHVLTARSSLVPLPMLSQDYVVPKSMMEPFDEKNNEYKPESWIQGAEVTEFSGYAHNHILLLHALTRK